VVARSGSSTQRWWFSHTPFRAARSDLLLEPNQALRQVVMLSRRHNDLVQAIQRSLVVSMRVITSLCASYGLSPDSSYPHSFQSAAITVSVHMDRRGGGAYCAAAALLRNTSIMGCSHAQLCPNEVTKGLLDLGMRHRRLLAIP
jgi:hypothetical protein